VTNGVHCWVPAPALRSRVAENNPSAFGGQLPRQGEMTGCSHPRALRIFTLGRTNLFYGRTNYTEVSLARFWAYR